MKCLLFTIILLSSTALAQDKGGKIPNNSAEYGPTRDLIENTRMSIVGKKFETLTIGDVQYANATVSKIDDAGIILIHSSGVAKYRWSDLPIAVKKAWGYHEGISEAAEKKEIEELAKLKEQRAAMARLTQIKQERDALLRRFEVEYDKFDRRTSYLRTPSEEPTESGLVFYIIVSDEDRKPVIYMKPIYVGKDWIFMDGLKFSGIDHKPIEFEAERESKAFPHLVEWAHIEADPEKLTDLLKNGTGIRFLGKYYVDLPFTESKKQELKDTLLLYDILGGEGM